MFANLCFGAACAVALALAAAFPPDARAMEGKAFKKLIEGLEEEGFSSDQLNLLRAAASTNTFTCGQALSIFKVFDFSGDRLKALEVLKDRIEDPENRHLLLEAFDFDADKKKASDILSGMGKSGPGKQAPPAQCLDALIVNHAAVWPEDRIAALADQLAKESFSEGKKRVLRLAVESNPLGLASAQLVRLLNAFGFDSDMVDAVGILEEHVLGMTSAEIIPVLERFSFSADRLKVLDSIKDTITDPENKFGILKAFDFSSDKEKARKILESVKARSHIYGTVRCRKVVFVVDVSGSMAATFSTNRDKGLSRLKFVARELEFVLQNQLDPEARFNVIAFSSGVTAWRDEMVPASKANVATAVEYVEGLNPAGGTDIHSALAQALSFKEVEAVYFLTDGRPTEGRTDPEAILKDVAAWTAGRKVRINAVAFLMGSHHDDDKVSSRSLMLGLARLTNGIFRSLE